MLECLAIVEYNSEGITASSLRLLSRLHCLPGWSQVRMAAVVFGICPEDCLVQLAKRGISKVYQVEGLDTYSQENWRKAILEIVAKQQISLLILPGTSTGRELSPGLAVELDAAVVADCQELSCLEDNLVAVTAVYNGQYQQELKLEGKYNIALMADIDPGAVECTGCGDCTLTTIAAQPMADSTVEVLASYYLPGSQLDIGEAEVVVGIGRGVETREDLELVRELAATLDAAIAGSRPAVDAGHITFARQVGQTGRLIAPQIYLAIGISGAPQHITGVGEAKIVAINSDPQAPILRLADLGVSGDLRQVVPLVTRLVKQIKEERQ